MGWLGDIEDFLEDVGDGFATIGGILIDTATFPFKTLGAAIKFVTDKAGDGLKAGFSEVGLNIVGDPLDFIIDKAGEKIQGIIERGAQYVEKLPSRIGRTANDFFSDNLWNNFGRWLSENLINAGQLAGWPEILETLADILKFNSRTLTDREKEIARSVFGDSINLDLVRIDEYSLGNLVNGKRPFTTFNTINTWEALEDPTLIHELTHVWQYGQVGAIYIPDALSSQEDSGVPGSPEDYPPDIISSGISGYRYGGFTELQKRINNGQKLTSFNYEQQAQIVEDYYRLRKDDGTDNDQYLPLYARFVQEVSTLSLSSLIHATLLNASGRITLLRVHEQSSGYGPHSDHIDGEVIIQLDSEPDRAFGFQLRPDENFPMRYRMLALLRDAFTHNRIASIDYLRTGSLNGTLIRATVL